MRLTENEKMADLNIIRNELLGIDIATQVYEKGGELGDAGILSVVYDESNYAQHLREENGENAEIALVGYMFELDDEDDQVNKYILMYSELSGRYDEYDELELYKKLTEFNKKVATGYFYPERDEQGAMKVAYKHTMHSRIGEPFDSVTYCELLIQAIYYMGILTDELKHMSGENQI